MRKILFKIINSVPFIGNVYWKRYFNKEVTKSWEAETVVLVYQMGKVGSSTLTKSINQSGQKISAFHIHFLATLKKHEAFSKQSGVFPYHHHLYIGNAVNNCMAKSPKNIKVITAVRDPLAILLSNFYQNEPFFIEGDFRNNGKYDIDKIKNHLIEDLQKGTTLCFFENWFSDEFEKALNIDVFKLEFNQEQGFGVYKFDGMDLMIVQAEKINDLETEFANFLNCENFKLQYDNVRSETEDAESYNKLKSTISFDKEIIDQVYSSRLVQYFYNHSQITGFSKKWNQHNS